MSTHSPRHRAREIALQFLYGNEDLATNLEMELKRHFEHFSVPEDTRDFATQLVLGTLREKASLDELLEKHVSNWKISRLSFVDRNLLRMAVYEMLHFPDTSPSIVIDEAIELGKQFGTSETPAFINGVLDAVKAAVR